MFPSIVQQIESGGQILFNLECQSIQVFFGNGLLNPIPWSDNREDTAWTCLLLKDEDSCAHIAGLIAALTGLVVGESKSTPRGIIFPLLLSRT